MGNIERYAPLHHGLDVTALLALCSRWVEKIESAEYTLNPWTPEAAPRVMLEV
jgi:hypothetical protein